jgi:pimeloyl-ACP methyl ester carboxylesterase
MRPELLDVEVEGGVLRVARWPGDGPVAIAAHGITGNALSWAEVARQLGGTVTLVAPDLRGRGESWPLPGPYGMRTHAGDLIRVLDAVGADRAVFAGHSMGGWVVGTAAALYPDRVERLVLVDGGLPRTLPEGMTTEQALRSTLGPTFDRLRMTFSTEQAYRDFWQRHPAFSATPWTDALDAYVLRDLVGEPGALRPACVEAAVERDGEELWTNSGAAGTAKPALLLLAERGLQNQPEGFYDRATIEFDQQVELLRDVNHYTIMFDALSAKTIADRIAGVRADPST